MALTLYLHPLGIVLPQGADRLRARPSVARVLEEAAPSLPMFRLNPPQ